MKPNQMFIAGTRTYKIPAEKTESHQEISGQQFVVIYTDAYGNLKADNISVRKDVFDLYSGPAVYDVVIGIGSKPVILDVKKVKDIVL